MHWMSLAGYTVSSVIVGDWRRLYVAGAPRFKHKGKVILFELSNDGDVSIAQALNGEQVMCVCVCVFRVFSTFSETFCQCFWRRTKPGHWFIKTRAPPTGRKSKCFFCVRVCVSNLRLGLTMAVRCVGWMWTRTASLTYF